MEHHIFVSNIDVHLFHFRIHDICGNKVFRIIHVMKMFCLIFILFIATFAQSKQINWKRDPSYCQVCTNVIDDINKQLEYFKNRENVHDIEMYLNRHCHISNRNLRKEERYICKSITKNIRAISTPLTRVSTSKKICKILERADPSICKLQYKKSTRLDRVPRDLNDL